MSVLLFIVNALGVALNSFCLGVELGAGERGNALAHFAMVLAGLVAMWFTRDGWRRIWYGKEDA